MCIMSTRVSVVAALVMLWPASSFAAPSAAVPDQTRPSAPKPCRVLSLSGGGSYGAFEAGVLKRLLDEEPALDYDFITGVLFPAQRRSAPLPSTHRSNALLPVGKCRRDEYRLPLPVSRPSRRRPQRPCLQLLLAGTAAIARIP